MNEYYRPKDRTDGLDLGIQNAVKEAWNTQVTMIYDRGYEDGKQDAVVDSKEAYQKGYEEGLSASKRKDTEAEKKRIEEAYQKGYDKGFDDAEAARADVLNEERKVGYNVGYEDGKAHVLMEQRQRLNEQYNKGYDKGLKDTEAVKGDALKEQFENGYNVGLEEAWELAGRLISNRDCIRELFDGALIDLISEKHTVHEILKKVKAWEEKQNQAEIKVGDEVIFAMDDCGIVTHVGDIYCTILCGDGTSYKYAKEDCRKTGRSFITELSNMLSMVKSDEKSDGKGGEL